MVMIMIVIMMTMMMIIMIIIINILYIKGSYEKGSSTGQGHNTSCLPPRTLCSSLRISSSVRARSSRRSNSAIFATPNSRMLWSGWPYVIYCERKREEDIYDDDEIDIKQGMRYYTVNFITTSNRLRITTTLYHEDCVPMG